MRDSHIYTKEGLEERIRELRHIREMITDREAYLVQLHSDTIRLGSPVNALGRSVILGAARCRHKQRICTKRQVAQLVSPPEWMNRQHAVEVPRASGTRAARLPRRVRSFRFDKRTSSTYI